jgi:hypothetical protein
MHTISVHVRSVAELGAILFEARSGHLAQDPLPLLEIDALVFARGGVNHTA